MADPKPVHVLVSGDFVLDHHIYEGQRQHFGDNRHRGVHEVEELGGAALVHYLLQALGGDKLTSHLSVAVGVGRIPVLPPDERVPPELSAYAVWRPFGREGEVSPAKLVWRTEDAMGFGGCPATSADFEWPAETDLPAHPEVVVLCDGGMGFRGDQELWPTPLLDKARWIVLKTSEPLAEGDLWEHLTAPGFQNRLVVITSASELRKSTAQLSSGLSWDATIESVLQSLAPGGALEGLTKCRHLVVAFGGEGGLWLEVGKQNDGHLAHLVYDTTEVEGEHQQAGRGKAFGALSCLTAAVAWRLAGEAEEPDLEAALEGGLSAMTDLQENGHGKSSIDGAGYPAGRLAKVIKDATCRYARTVFAASMVSANPPCADTPQTAVLPCWSIVHEALRKQGTLCPEPAWDLAERVARYGPIALGSLPHLCIGKLTSADRREIEALRVLRRLILDYRDRKRCPKPLSIGVFGPPGAGKSFAVKQIAYELIGKAAWMEFNLAQFEKGTRDLIGAFHQIRDRVLRDGIAVAFFDEFDSSTYFWLQYLLAPMQDGAFQEGQVTHPIGKCIFIFAGGTSSTFESLGPPGKDRLPDPTAKAEQPHPTSEKYEKALAAFKMAKGPDFKSRLDGFLDVLGPNQRRVVEVDDDGESYKEVTDGCDIFFPVRRAFVLRAELGCKPTDALDIDAGVLRGLLRVDLYRHGARSMSKVIEPLKAAGSGTIYRSQLPPRRQLDLQVRDSSGFHQKCDAHQWTPPKVELSDADRETIAKAIHDTWQQLGEDQGWLEEGHDVGFGELSDFYEASNLEAAERMWKALALIGLTLEKGQNTDPERETIRLKLEYNLELLADTEHRGWMDWHLDQGWELGDKPKEVDYTKPPTDLHHPCLRPYLHLSDRERNKDRDTIRHYPDFVEKAGMKIVEI